MRNFGIVFYSIHMSLLVRMWKYMWTVECRCCNMFKLSCIVEVNPFYCYSTLSIELRASIHSLIQLSLTHTETHISLCACMKWQSLTKSKTTMAHSGGKFLCHFCHWVFGSQTDGTLCVCVCVLRSTCLSFQMQHRISLLRLKCLEEEHGMGQMIEKWTKRWK